MLTKSVKSVISVVLKHVALVTESVLSVRSVSILAAQLRFATFNCKLSYNIRVVLPINNNIKLGLNSSVGIQPLKFFERCSVTMNKGTHITGQQ